jgi:hypothetical protein
VLLGHFRRLLEDLYTGKGACFFMIAFCFSCIVVYNNVYSIVYMNVLLDVYCGAIQGLSGKETLVSALTPCQKKLRNNLESCKRWSVEAVCWRAN